MIGLCQVDEMAQPQPWEVAGGLLNQLPHNDPSRGRRLADGNGPD